VPTSQTAAGLRRTGRAPIALPLICPTCPAPFEKIFLFSRSANQSYDLLSHPERGALANVINAGRGAVDAETTMRWGTAPILQAVIAPTKLAALRRIDSPEANARPMNFQRVAIDDAGLPYTPAKPIHELERYMRYRVGKNRKWAVATQTGSRTVSDSANRKQVGQLNRCRLVTGTNLTSSDRYNCISMPQVGQVGASRSSSECFSLSITNPPQVG
jgi:hypothetical protein